MRTSVFADLAPRIEAHTRRGGDLIELHIGDTYLAPPDQARFSGVEGPPFDAALYRYGAIAGLGTLREAFAAYLGARGVGPPTVDAARHVLVGCGATHAIFCAARSVLDPGDEVVVAAPYWPLAVGVLRAAGAIPIEVPLTTRLYADPSLDAGAVLEEAITPRTRALYIATPNNPDGKVLSEGQLARIARLAVARGLWVIADEVYADFVMEERTITAYSLSKSHALAGARVGFIVARESVVAVARRIATHTVFNVPVATQRVALAALAAPPSWMQQAKRAYRESRDATMVALDGAGVRAFAPEGGSYVFIDFAPVLAGRTLRQLLECAIDLGVLVAPGDGCGEGFTTWARLCFTSVPHARLIEGIRRLRQAC